jgi:iduronate 2-sulfatase
MYTPNIDSLASRSLLLERAYVQQALCGPSRASFLTGRRPDTTHIYKCGEYFRKKGGNFTTIPQYFKMNGYKSIGMGKIFHFKGKNSGGNDPISWSEPYFHGARNYEQISTSWAAIPDEELDSKPLLDDQTANHAIETMRNFSLDNSTDKQPFFLAVGFRRPHLPFVFPASVLEYYPEVSLPHNPSPPIDMPTLSWTEFKRFTSYSDVKYTGTRDNARLTHSTVLSLRRAYYSSVTWVDHHVGRILQELETLGLSNNTIISFIGDHGFQLGEHGSWGKQTNFELSAHAPMMIHIPGRTDLGIRSSSLVEFVDLFPTLVEAAGLNPLPPCPENSNNVELCREGVSLLPLINETDKRLRGSAFSQTPRDDFMGYSIKTTNFRYTEWPRFDKLQFKPQWSDSSSVELYDHRIDPEENVNCANDPAYRKVINRLRKRLRAGWRKSFIGSVYDA